MGIGPSLRAEFRLSGVDGVGERSGDATARWRVALVLEHVIERSFIAVILYISAFKDVTQLICVC